MYALKIEHFHSNVGITQRGSMVGSAVDPVIFLRGCTGSSIRANPEILEILKNFLSSPDIVEWSGEKTDDNASHYASVCLTCSHIIISDLTQSRKDCFQWMCNSTSLELSHHK